jgi:hypothetical protein
VEAISLGALPPDATASAPVAAGGTVYIGITQNRESSVRAYDLASRKEVASLMIDRLLPPVRGVDEGSPSRADGAARGISLRFIAFLPDRNRYPKSGGTSRDQVPARNRLRPLYGYPRPLAWQDNRLFEIRIYPQKLASYDLSDPARPSPMTDLTMHEGMTIAGSGQMLYRPWRSGVMEFQARGNDLQALHYLRSDREIAALAVSGESVYALTGAELHERRKVHVFRPGH